MKSLKKYLNPNSDGVKRKTIFLSSFPLTYGKKGEEERGTIEAK